MHLLQARVTTAGKEPSVGAQRACRQVCGETLTHICLPGHTHHSPVSQATASVLLTSFFNALQPPLVLNQEVSLGHGAEAQSNPEILGASAS